MDNCGKKIASRILDDIDNLNYCLYPKKSYLCNPKYRAFRSNHSWSIGPDYYKISKYHEDKLMVRKTKYFYSDRIWEVELLENPSLNNDNDF